MICDFVLQRSRLLILRRVAYEDDLSTTMDLIRVRARKYAGVHGTPTSLERKTTNNDIIRRVLIEYQPTTART